VSQEDAEFAREAWEAGADGLDEMARTYWHPDVEYVEDPRWPGASRYQGREAVLRCFRAYLAVLGPAEDMSITVERVLDAGERQVVFIKFQGRSASGIPHEHRWAYVVEARERRIVYLRAYYEPEEALKAIGLMA
jgi:ketosteroid isomerase-like protein